MGKVTSGNQHRGHHEGHFRFRNDGRWECMFTMPDGKRKSVYGKSRPDVRAKLEESLGKAKKGIDLKGERQHLGDFLAAWMAETQAPSCGPPPSRATSPTSSCTSSRRSATPRSAT